MLGLDELHFDNTTEKSCTETILNDLKIKTVLQIKRTLLFTLHRDIGTKRLILKAQYGYIVFLSK